MPAPPPARSAPSPVRPKSYGTLPPGGDHVFQWESRGNPWMLLLSVVILLIRQYLALGLIIIAVFENPFQQYIHGKNARQKFLMACNPFKLTTAWEGAYACELTKTAVRFFPLLGLVVLQLIGGHMLSHQRLFYVLLRNDVMLKFENRNPLKDTVLWTLLALAILAICHYVLLFYENMMGGVAAPRSNWESPRGERSRAMANNRITFAIEDVEHAILVYFVPMGLFMFCLYTSYNFTEQMLPLNKYWDEDPEYARKASTDMGIINEETLARVVWSNGDSEKKLPVSSGLDNAEKFQDTILEMAEHAPSDNPPPRDLTLIYSLWSSRLLLDRKIIPADISRFRIVWWLYVVDCAIAFALCMFLLVDQMQDDMSDVFRERHMTDAPAVLLEVILFILMGHLVVEFVRREYSNLCCL